PIALLICRASRSVISDTPFSFTAPPPPPIYTLSLHDALPISDDSPPQTACAAGPTRSARSAPHKSGNPSENPAHPPRSIFEELIDRKSTRLNSSHRTISYAVFCLKKKKKKKFLKHLSTQMNFS